METLVRNPITANSESLNLKEATYEQVREATKGYFNRAQVIDPQGEVTITPDGLINGEYRLTPSGFSSLCTYFKVNANTIKALWEIDPTQMTDLMQGRIRTCNNGTKLRNVRLLTHGDKIEGFATERYGDIPTLTVLDEYNKINPEVEYTRVMFNGLRSRFTTMAPEAQQIEPKVGDVIRVGQDFQNSQDGSLCFAINFILWRLVCSNGMVVGGKGLESRIIHKGNHALDKSIQALNVENLDLVTLNERLVESSNIFIGEDRMEFLYNKVFKGVSKKFAQRVVTEYDHPTCPSAKAGNTLYDFWNAVTHQAKFMGDDQRKAERFAYNLLTGKIPVENNPARARTAIEV